MFGSSISLLTKFYNIKLSPKTSTYLNKNNSFNISFKNSKKKASIAMTLADHGKTSRNLLDNLDGTEQLRVRWVGNKNESLELFYHQSITQMYERGTY